MKTSIFYFAGRAGDLPAALLRHATEGLKADNQKRAKLLAGPLRTFRLISSAATHRSIKVTTNDGFRYVDLGRAALNELKRPPLVLTGKAFSKCKTCGGMGYLAQLDQHGEALDYTECPQCHPAYSAKK